MSALSLREHATVVRQQEAEMNCRQHKMRELCNRLERLEEQLKPREFPPEDNGDSDTDVSVNEHPTRLHRRLTVDDRVRLFETFFACCPNIEIISSAVVTETDLRDEYCAWLRSRNVCMQPGDWQTSILNRVLTANGCRISFERLPVRHGEYSRFQRTIRGVRLRM
jgi:hypothetical protein